MLETQILTSFKIKVSLQDKCLVMSAVYGLNLRHTTGRLSKSCQNAEFPIFDVQDFAITRARIHVT